MTSATPKPRAGEHTFASVAISHAIELDALRAECDLLRKRDKVLVAAIEAALAYCESEAIGTVQQEIADNERMRQTLRNALEYGR